MPLLQHTVVVVVLFNCWVLSMLQVGGCKAAQDCLVPMGITSENVAGRYGVDRSAPLSDIPAHVLCAMLLLATVVPPAAQRRMHSPRPRTERLLLRKPLAALTRRSFLSRPPSRTQLVHTSV